MNPMQMFQNVDPTPNNPFWSGMMGQRNQAQAMPFMENQMQDQQMDLMQKRFQMGEFQSPLAVQSRQTNLQHGIATKNAEMEMLPYKNEYERKKYAEDLRALPFMTDEKIAKADQVMRSIKSAPHKALLEELSGAFPHIQKQQSELGKAQAYLAILNKWKAENPNIEVPEQLRMFGPHMLPDLAAMHYAQVNKPEHVQKLEQIRETGNQALLREGMEQEGANVRNDASVAAQRYTADAGRARAQETMTPQKRLASLKTKLNRDWNQEDNDEYMGYIQEAWDKKEKDDPALLMLRMQGMQGNKKALADFQLEKRKYFAGHMVNPDYEWDGVTDPEKKSAWKPKKKAAK